jgi:hypothetical protein
MATPHVPVTYTILTLAAARRQLIQLRKSHNRDAEEGAESCAFCASSWLSS